MPQKKLQRESLLKAQVQTILIQRKDNPARHGKLI